jgi:rare lipoprotein A
MSLQWAWVPVSVSGKRPDIFRYEYLSRVGNVVIALAGTTLFAYCIICAAGNGAYADSRPPQQARDLGATASAKKEGPCDQSERASPAGFAPSIAVSATAGGGTIVGVASWYNPYVELDETETASGEQYDPDQWTAAIQIDLRDAFGGVGFGKDYRAAYALVESGDKRMIVKINDVGPLRPGRVIDLSERAMRYLDETLLSGLVPDVKLTLLPGGDWMPGPIVSDPVKTYRCGSRDAGREDGPKRLSALENSEPQTERPQGPDALIRRDQHRGATPSPRSGASGRLDEGRARRTGARHLRDADLTEESVSEESSAQARAVRARSGRKVRRVDAETRYLEEAAGE